MLEGRTSTPYLTKFCLAIVCARRRVGSDSSAASSAGAGAKAQACSVAGRVASRRRRQRVFVPAHLDDDAHVCHDEKDDYDIDEASVVVVRVLGAQHRGTHGESDVHRFLLGCTSGHVLSALRRALLAVPAASRASIARQLRAAARGRARARPDARVRPAVPRAVRALGAPAV